jgi:hypothetical protein
MIHQQTEILDPIERALLFTQRIVSDFCEKYREPLQLNRPEHFAKLAHCIDLREWERQTCAREGGLDFRRYDVASLLCQHHLKFYLPTQLATDQHHAFIDAIFPKLYYSSSKEYQRMIADIDHLIGSVPEAELTYQLESVKAEWRGLHDARNKGIALHPEIYNKAFDDAFHNPMLDHCAPIYFDLIRETEPTTLREIRELLQRRLDRSA